MEEYLPLQSPFHQVSNQAVSSVPATALSLQGWSTKKVLAGGAITVLKKDPRPPAAANDGKKNPLHNNIF